jgi:hypothetical protein
MSDPFARSALENLSIERFIFHIIHDGGEEPQLLEEVPPGEFAPFFLELVTDCARGNRYLFHDRSHTCQQLQAIQEDPALFEEKSRELARSFHLTATGAASPGVLFFMQLAGQQERYFALIKYDNQRVLQYHIGESRKVSLDELTNTITQNRSALQKSALIHLGAEGAELLLRDRQATGGEIAAYFRNFLDVYRKQGQDEISRALRGAVSETVHRHAADLPDDMIRETSDRFVEVAGRGPRDQEEFYRQFFGETDPSVRDTFMEQAQRRGIDQDNALALDQDAAARPRKKRYTTVGGITILAPADTCDFFEIVDTAPGEVRITIRTNRLWEH